MRFQLLKLRVVVLLLVVSSSVGVVVGGIEVEVIQQVKGIRAVDIKKERVQDNKHNNKQNTNQMKK
jgi:hypothetical protein